MKHLPFLKIQIISLKNTHHINLKILVISQMHFITDNFISIFLVLLYQFKIYLYYLYKKLFIYIKKLLFQTNQPTYIFIM